ncbi:hypothetical protein MBAV_004631 [Candidatus Magnetobacterium bavaricum]|uniref:Uncharacterized protein n=1 Tax=Candidatus Magnetobacterium bavaricum TaxID=29290 RepID=A0A0F3GMX1_9BACT|nr:hypothetical protein MBAV_004631 [Candidatus Magnetobacterium bavaricum]
MKRNIADIRDEVTFLADAVDRIIIGLRNGEDIVDGVAIGLFWTFRRLIGDLDCIASIPIHSLQDAIPKPAIKEEYNEEYKDV